MTEVRDLNCPLMTKVVLHTYNKNRAPVLGADGKYTASKLKNTATAKALAIRYGLIVQPQFLKNNVRELNSRCDSEEWKAEDEGYDSESVKNALMSRYPSAIPGTLRIAAKGGAASVIAPAAAPSTAVTAGQLHLGRQLQLIHGSLIDIASELRVISGRATAGSRGKVSAAASFLLNGTAEEDESDDDETTTKTKTGRAAASRKRKEAPPSSSSSDSDEDDEAEDDEGEEEEAEEGEQQMDQGPDDPADALAAEMAAAAAAPPKSSKKAQKGKGSAAAKPDAAAASAAARSSKKHLGPRRG